MYWLYWSGAQRQLALRFGLCVYRWVCMCMCLSAKTSSVRSVYWWGWHILYSLCMSPHWVLSNLYSVYRTWFYICCDTVFEIVIPIWNDMVLNSGWLWLLTCVCLSPFFLSLARSQSHEYCTVLVADNAFQPIHTDRRWTMPKTNPYIPVHNGAKYVFFFFLYYVCVLEWNYWFEFGANGYWWFKCYVMRTQREGMYQQPYLPHR